MHAADLPAACENCRTALHGAYCHACGQQAANPLRSFLTIGQPIVGTGSASAPSSSRVEWGLLPSAKVPP